MALVALIHDHGRLITPRDLFMCHSHVVGVATSGANESPPWDPLMQIEPASPIMCQLPSQSPFAS